MLPGHRAFASTKLILALVLTASLLGTLLTVPAHGQENFLQIAPASNEGELATKKFHLAPGFKVELVAAEPHLANPVAFCIDEKGRFYVCETFRLGNGVTDIRGKDTWLDEDLASRTVSDRLAMMKRHLGEKVSSFGLYPDRLKLIEDRNGDGKADHSTVFADGFTNILDGIAAGVLAHKGNVWFGNIPNLWMLKDNNGDGVADERKSLHYGYGVRVGFLGHDLHGLRFGPDGKLYFSIGDRGSSIKVDGKIVGHPDTGCVFRCNPDGSELEVFAFGLRNPQELAFDQYGNLFTGDNNSDGGDRARLVCVVEGGDSGWRIGYQFIEWPNFRGPWNSEKLWHPQWEGQAAHIIPPIANLADGPSGFAYNPGTGMPSRYNEHFFLCDFHGGKGSGIHSFAVKPKGAGFEITDRQNFLWECLPTDVDFGVDGGIYYTDWVEGWSKTGKGRIYRVYEPAVVKQPVVFETKKLLAEGMTRRSTTELARLLAHSDMRIRQEAQFELADRGGTSVKTLADVASKNSSQLARLHGIWGLGQIVSRLKIQSSPRVALETLNELLKDKDAEVRAQAAKVAGDVRLATATDELVRLLQDPAPRPRFYAAIGLGKLGRKETLPAVLSMLRSNADSDPYLRHAGVMALVGIHEMDALMAAAKDDSRSVRMAAVIAMRRLERPEIAVLLNDQDPQIVLEAARAINDQPINGATSELAALLGRPNLSEPLLRRALNANLRLGIQESAAALARFAQSSSNSDGLRTDALLALADWVKPSGRDRVTGVWRPVAGLRDVAHAQQALRPAVAEILRTAPDETRIAAIRAADRLGLDANDAELFALIGETQLSPRVRVEALRALADHRFVRLPEAIALAAKDSQESLRKEALRLQARIQPSNAAGQLVEVLKTGSLAEKQNAFDTLGALKDDRADQILGEWIDKLLAGQAPAELQLDLLEAAAARPSMALKSKLAQYEGSFKPSDPLAPFRVTLLGGNAAEGRKIFYEKADVYCLRCHKLAGVGGEAGPDLTGLGARQNREYILESLIFPNKQVAPGFENLLVTLKNGTVYAGMVKAENERELILNSPEDGVVTVLKNEISSRARGTSAMPEGIGVVLTKQQIRDLVEFLANLK